jgi:lysophospholipase L1-like esterase
MSSRATCAAYPATDVAGGGIGQRFGLVPDRAGVRLLLVNHVGFGRITPMKAIIFLLALLSTAAAPVFAADAPAKRAGQAAAPRAARQLPDVPAPKLGTNGQPQTAFIRSHEKFVGIARQGDTGLLFLGDSITAGWTRQQTIWSNAFGAYRPANFGIGGDRTQHVLWRINNGELDVHKPKAVVLMIGTNNSGSDEPEDTARGVTKIVETIRAKLPDTKILLLGIFPRGATTTNNPGRAKNQKVNALIAKLHDGRHVYYLDIGEKFLQPDGTLTKEIMPDLLHLSAKGYQIWADSITPRLAELMK